MDNHIHVPALEELLRALAHVFEIGRPRRNDVDDAEDLLLAGRGAVWALRGVDRMVVIWESGTMRRKMAMRRVGVWMIMAMRVIVVAIVFVCMIMDMCVWVRMLAMLFVGVDFRVCSAGVLEPEPRDRVPHYSPQGAQFLKGVASYVF
jgi:hypothetical protein